MKHSRPRAHIRRIRTKSGMKKKVINPHIRKVRVHRIEHGKKGFGILKGVEGVEEAITRGLKEEEQAVVIVGRGVVKGTEDLGHGAVKIVAGAEDTALRTGDDLAKGSIEGVHRAAKGSIDVAKGTTKAVIRREL